MHWKAGTKDQLKSTEKPTKPTLRDSVASAQNFVKYHKDQKHGPWSKKLIMTCMSNVCTVVTDGQCWDILVVNLQGGRLTPGAVQVIQLAESAFCPDAEAPNVTTGSKSQEVQFVHVLQSDA